GRARGGGRGGGVLAVVRPADQRLRRELVFGREFGNSYRSVTVANDEPPGDDRRPGPLEDPQLRVPVRVERAVAVEVVRLEVEQDGDLAGERVHVLELEARELADDPVGGAHARERRA